MSELTREQINQHIASLECLQGVMSAIDDVSGVEFEPGEERALNVSINDRTQFQRAVAFVVAIPPGILLAGLREMQRELGRQLEREKRAALPDPFKN